MATSYYTRKENDGIYGYYYIILNVILCPYYEQCDKIKHEWRFYEFLKSKNTSLYLYNIIYTLKYIMRYKPVHKYRFYQNSWGGWIYKSFFFIRSSLRMQVGAIRDIDNGGRSFWKKSTEIIWIQNITVARLGHIDLSASEDFERIFMGRFSSSHTTNPFLFNRPIYISIWAKSRTNIAIFWKRYIFVIPTWVL